MTGLVKVGSYVDSHPGAAVADVLGLGLICVLILAGLSLPAVL